MWGATIRAGYSPKTANVSIHAPVWGATTGAVLGLNTAKFQSTHPCGVRQNDVLTAIEQLVSIHAPVWGATITPQDNIGVSTVSIHAPVWGATNPQPPSNGW